jgi:hypothetical protein
MTGQTEFRSALLNAELPVPSGLTDGKGQPAGRRYSVYRNNVAVSLREALTTGFPVVSGLIGDENFNHIAGLFLRQSPPESPVMMQYGTGFPEFLHGFEPLAHIGYLPDVARLELAMRQSYHAADSQGIDPAILQQMSEEQLMAMRLELAPSVRLLTSPWPVVSIWNYARDPSSGKPPAVAEDAIILRPEFDPLPHALHTGGRAFITTLAKGQPLDEALEAAGAEFDLGPLLNLLLFNKAITRILT